MAWFTRENSWRGFQIFDQVETEKAALSPSYKKNNKRKTKGKRFSPAPTHQQAPHVCQIQKPDQWETNSSCYPLGFACCITDRRAQASLISWAPETEEDTFSARLHTSTHDVA